MALLRQLELNLQTTDALTSILSLGERRTRSAGEGNSKVIRVGPDEKLEQQARELLRANAAGKIANEIRVEWNPRLKSCAGRADYRQKLISLNPQLHELDSVNRQSGSDIDRTFRHELAHLLAQFRAGRRRILPHGKEWRTACVDLGIGDEKRCHNLPFEFIQRGRRYLYKCPNCKRDFPRVRRIRRAIACLACCRAH